MNYYYFVLLVALCLVLSNIMQEEVNCTKTHSDDEWDDYVWSSPTAIVNTIYKDKRVRQPDEIGALLIRLEQLGYINSDDQQLLYINEIESEKCRAYTYYTLKRLYRNELRHDYSDNLSNYIKDRFKKWMNLCVSKINETVKTIVNDDLSSEEQNQMNLLREMIFFSDPKKADRRFIYHLDIPKKDIILGVVKYMERDEPSNKDKILNKKTGEEEFKIEFDNSIGKLCLKVVGIVEPTYLFYLKLSDPTVWSSINTEFREQNFIDEVINWRDNLLICKHIIKVPFFDTKDTIERVIYKYLVKRDSNLLKQGWDTLIKNFAPNKKRRNVGEKIGLLGEDDYDEYHEYHEYHEKNDEELWDLDEIWLHEDT